MYITFLYIIVIRYLNLYYIVIQQCLWIYMKIRKNVLIICDCARDCVWCTKNINS